MTLSAKVRPDLSLHHGYGVRVRLDWSRIHLFDAESGAALESAVFRD